MPSTPVQQRWSEIHSGWTAAGQPLELRQIVEIQRIGAADRQRHAVHHDRIALGDLVEHIARPAAGIHEVFRDDLEPIDLRAGARGYAENERTAGRRPAPGSDGLIVEMAWRRLRAGVRVRPQRNRKRAATRIDMDRRLRFRAVCRCEPPSLATSSPGRRRRSCRRLSSIARSARGLSARSDWSAERCTCRGRCRCSRPDNCRSRLGLCKRCRRCKCASRRWRKYLGRHRRCCLSAPLPLQVFNPRQTCGSPSSGLASSAASARPDEARLHADANHGAAECRGGQLLKIAAIHLRSLHVVTRFLSKDV